MKAIRGATILAIAATAAIAAVTAADGQVVQRPPETASLSGIVRDHAGAPVRLAIVELDGEAMASPRSRLTDDDGRFQFESLPPGRFALTAEKAAYVTSHWGARRPGRPGTPLILLEGERRAGVEVTMPRGGVITGILRDLNGRPVEHAEVAAFPAGRPLIQSSYEERLIGATTDDQGRYRLFGLTPGDYAVVAALRRVGLGPLDTFSDRDVDRLLNEARDRTAASASAANRPRASVDVPTFYPGTARLTDAAAVRVGAGQERDGVDFTLTFEPAALVSGQLVAPGGVDLSNATIAMTPAIPRVMLSTVAFSQTIGVSSPSPDGHFSAPGVPPGDYSLVARWSPSSEGGRGRSSGPASEGRGMLWAHANVSVNGEDVSGLVLTMQPGLDVRGRFVFEGDDPPPEPNAMGAYRVTLKSEMTAPPAQFGLTVNQGARSAIGPNRTFTFAPLIPDVYDVEVTAPTDLTGWWARSVVANGVDVLDYGLDLRTSLDDLVATFTRAETTLTGTLFAGPGIPAPGYVIVVFPEDQAMWRSNARRVRASRPADDGTFLFERLPAGAYRVAALTDIEDGEWNQPAFLEQLLPASQPVTVTEGVETRFDIRIAR